MKLDKNIILLKNCGFCYGVNHSIKIVLDTLNNKKTPRPIYLLNSIVHNKFVNDYFIKKGIIILEGKSKLELLDQIKCGTVIFSAHGVGDNIKDKAMQLNLNIVDATCPFVEKSYQLIKEYLFNDYYILYIGKQNHPETEAVLSFSKNVMLISNLDFKIPKNVHLAIAHQTTMSDYDVNEIYQKVKDEVDDITVLPMLCNETQKRQHQLLNYLENNDLTNALVIIVGDHKSNNCTKLYELGIRYTPNTIFIYDYNELKNYDLTIYDKFIISSGTSTPIINVQNIVNYINNKQITKVKDLTNYIN